MNLPLIPATSSNKKSPKAFPSVLVTRGAQRGRRHRFGECAVSTKAGEWVAAAKEFSWTWKAKVTSTLLFFELHTYYLPTYNWDSEKSKPWRFLLIVRREHKSQSCSSSQGMFPFLFYLYVNETLSACYLSPSFRPPVLPQSHHYWLSCLPFLMRPLQQWVVRRRQRQRKKEKKWPFKHWPSEPALPGKKEIDRSVQQGI